MTSKRPLSPFRFGAACCCSVALGAGLNPRMASAVSVPPGFVVENAFPDQTFLQPVQVVFLPDGRTLVVEQRGKVWVEPNNRVTVH